MAPQNKVVDLVESSQRQTRSKQLPLELVEHIVASLDDFKDNKQEYRRSILPALKACSLVCWAWNDISRSRIFRTFTIKLRMAEDETEILPGLSFLHFTAPHHFKYIIDLAINWLSNTPDTPTWIPDALHRFVNLTGGGISTSQLNRIEMPNLDSLACAYRKFPFPDAPWLPDGLSAVSLLVSQDSDLLRLGQSIRPSCLTINIFQSQRESSRLSVMAWVSRCLGCLPFSSQLRQLNINIKGTRAAMMDGPRYATCTDYQKLYHALRPLHKDGALERVKSTHWLISRTETSLDDISEQEAVLNEVFSPLLDARPLVFDITLEQWDEPLCKSVVVLQHRLQPLGDTAKCASSALA